MGRLLRLFPQFIFMCEKNEVRRGLVDRPPMPFLPAWIDYRASVGVETREPKETFDWMLDREYAKEMESVKAGLDTAEWSRKFLLEYVPPLEGFSSELDVIYGLVGDHHSGASASAVVRIYIYLLKNWDTFVLERKTAEQRKIYDEQQIHHSEFEPFLSGFDTLDVSEKAKRFEAFRQKWNVTYDDATLLAMFIAIDAEKYREYSVTMQKREEEDLMREIDLLKFLYRCPIRWFDMPFGLKVDQVTKKHIEELTKLYPDYPAHFKLVEQICMKNLPYKTVKTLPQYQKILAEPAISEEEKQAKSLIYPDYRKHIQAISDARKRWL